MILAGIATYFNSRASVARQSAEAAANPQTAMMNKLALYVFPLGVVVGGPFLPLAIIFYWFSNNIWTFGQQHYVFGMIEREEEEKKREAIERRAANAPAPGAKPKRSARRRRRPATVRRRRRGSDGETAERRRRSGQPRAAAGSQAEEARALTTDTVRCVQPDNRLSRAKPGRREGKEDRYDRRRHQRTRSARRPTREGTVDDAVNGGRGRDGESPRAIRKSGWSPREKSPATT